MLHFLPAVNHFTAAAIIFLGTYMVLALGRLPGFLVDRTGIAIIGAAAMVVSGVIGFEDAYRAVDYRTLVLLFGMMIVVANLRLSGFFGLVSLWALRRARNPRSLLIIVVALSGVLSALFVNDVVCLVLTPLVLVVTKSLRRSPVPYLIALGTASNIGSVATITGNPQNMIIGSLSSISYLTFSRYLAPLAAAGLAIDAALVLWIFRRDFSRDGTDSLLVDRRVRVDRPLLLKSAATSCALLVLFIIGVPVALAAIGAASFLLLTRRVKPQTVYRQIDWDLLVLFAGLFVVVAGVEVSGVSGWIFGHLPSLGAGHLAALGLSGVLLSNLVSNVPAVLLFKPVIPSFTNPSQAWLMLAAMTTLGGNLTLLGSIANLIVVESARRQGVSIGFWNYLRVGLPLTLVTTGASMVWLISFHP